MIDVIIADHQEPFRIGMAEILVADDDVCPIARASTPDSC